MYVEQRDVLELGGGDLTIDQKVTAEVNSNGAENPWGRFSVTTLQTKHAGNVDTANPPEMTVVGKPQHGERPGR